jgi:hypothetical protein
MWHRAYQCSFSNILCPKHSTFNWFLPVMMKPTFGIFQRLLVSLYRCRVCMILVPMCLLCIFLELPFSLIDVGTVYPKCYCTHRCLNVCLVYVCIICIILMLNSHYCLFLERQEVLLVFILRDVSVDIRA